MPGSGRCPREGNGYLPGPCEYLSFFPRWTTLMLRKTISSVQSLSHVRLFVTPWTAAHRASLSIANSWSLLKLMWCHPTISSSVIPFSSCLQSFPDWNTMDGPFCKSGDHFVDKWSQVYSTGLCWENSFPLTHTGVLVWRPLWVNFSD